VGTYKKKRENGKKDGDSDKKRGQGTKDKKNKKEATGK